MAGFWTLLMPVERALRLHNRDAIARTLRKSEERFRLVVEAAPNAMVMVNDAGLIEMVNAQAERLFGYDRAELMGRSIEMLTPERFRPDHPIRRARFFATLQPRTRWDGPELYGLKQDGREFPVEVSLNPIETDEGVMVLSSIIDISDRQRQEARFRQLVESTPNAVVVINAAGRIDMVNTQTERAFGYNRQELLGQDAQMLLPERYRAHGTALGPFAYAPDAQALGARAELFGLNKDGREFPIEMGLNLIDTDEGPMVLSAITDVSARKRLEARFRQVVEFAPSAMVLTNGAGTIEMINAQAERMFGYERSELLGQPVEMLSPERYRSDDLDRRRILRSDFLARSIGRRREIMAVRKDGGEFPVEFAINPLETDAGAMMLSSLVDISDRKQKDASIQAALKEKDLLLGEVHHRVKNNLQIVDSLLDMQMTHIADPRVVEVLRESQNRIRSMALIHQALYQSNDFARVDFRRFLQVVGPALVNAYGVNAERVALSLSLKEVLLPIGTAIPCGLIVNELISNALKHAFPNGADGLITIDLRYGGASDVCLTISDDGVGLGEAIDVKTSTTLGLQLVNMLVEQLGGEMEVQRDSTRFALRFPIQRWPTTP